MAWLFENCFPNTLDTTVRTGFTDGKPDTFVITGDIHAMWLRDSAAQVWPYLPLARRDGRLKTLIEGVIRRQTRSILIDPHADAFNFGPTGSEWDKDLTAMKPELHERKWEIDSLCCPVRLAYGYWKETGDGSIFDANWRRAAALIVRTFREQQRLRGPGPYHFQRVTAVPGDSLPQNGFGNPTRPCGLISLGLPAVGRRLHLSLPDPVEPVRGHVARTTARNPSDGTARQRRRTGLRGSRRAGSGSLAEVRCRGQAEIRRGVRL